MCSRADVDGSIVRRNMGRPRRSTIASIAGVRREFGRASSPDCHVRTADCEVRAADCHVRPRQCHVLASDSDVLVRNWRLPWFQWQVRKTEWQRRAGEKQARRSGCHVRRFECRVRQFQCRLRKRQRHVRRFRWHVRPIHGSTRGSLMPVVNMTAGFFTPSLIGYEPFFRARDALRITLRVSLEDKDDSPD